MATRQFIPCAHCGALFKQAVDGTKVLLCALCLAKGERVVLL